MSTQHPLQTLIQLPIRFASEVRNLRGTKDLFKLCVAASAARTLSVLEQTLQRWDDVAIGLLLPCLRPSCEDLIVLAYLRGLPSERNGILRTLMSESTTDSISAQKVFFEAERGFQPLLKVAPPDGGVESMKNIGARLGWPNRNRGSAFPSTFWIAQQVGMEPLYKFIYKLTSNIVHFNPQTLLRYCWGDENEWRIGVEEFHLYYRDCLAIYGCYLYHHLFAIVKAELQVSPDHEEAVRLMTLALQAQPRWPEMVTFEECNLDVPDHVSAWRSFMENHPNDEIRSIFTR